MDRVLIFAGTTEGRELAEYLSRGRYARLEQVHVCVATEYGEQLLAEDGAVRTTEPEQVTEDGAVQAAGKSRTASRENCSIEDGFQGKREVQVHTGRLAREAMEALMKKLAITFVVDATHPYAAEVSKNIRRACENTDTDYVRLVRESSRFAGEEGLVLVSSVGEAAEYLKGTKGNVLVTTGSKELAKFTEIENYKTRIFARVLSTPEAVASCAGLGFEGRSLICMQGPFTEELNYAMLRQIQASWLVTKESGRFGGFREKLAAAKRAGVKVILVGRPAKEAGSSSEEVRRLLDKRLGFKAAEVRTVRQQVSIVGIGMGNLQNMTLEALGVCQDADVLIGADRILETVRDLKKPELVSYQAEEIAAYLAAHTEYKKVAVLLSGDVGFYSGARKLLELLEKEEVRVYSGISSVVYFCGKLHCSWEDVYLMSLHGREQNIIGAAARHSKVFALVGDQGGVNRLCEKLCRYGMGDARVSVGENLSYPEECITIGKAEEFLVKEFEKLSVVLIENPAAGLPVTHGISDDDFLRDKVPMTKSEIRSISLSKLGLKKDSVVYDVGAGTGSVSVEMARQSWMGRVYAVEKKKEAVELLRQNQIRFAADNLEVVEGTAPGALEALTVPTHAFIGGSGGNLKTILKVILDKNPSVRVVINAIALETVAEVLSCLKELPVIDTDIVAVSVGKAKEVGSYHMMMGQNPVYIISFTGGGKTCGSQDF